MSGGGGSAGGAGLWRGAAARPLKPRRSRVARGGTHSGRVREACTTARTHPPASRRRRRRRRTARRRTWTRGARRCVPASHRATRSPGAQRARPAPPRPRAASPAGARGSG
eukprot:5305036-Prymnesium_polylepis.1